VGGNDASRTSIDGWRALALAVVGLLAMAIVGAAPGSPYQPLLTPGGHPRGPLTEIAMRLHLDAIPGDPILFVGVAVSIVAVLGFLALLRATFRGQVGLGAVAALVLKGASRVVAVAAKRARVLPHRPLRGGPRRPAEPVRARGPVLARNLAGRAPPACPQTA